MIINYDKGQIDNLGGFRINDQLCLLTKATALFKKSNSLLSALHRSLKLGAGHHRPFKLKSKTDFFIFAS
jgi:hypothetical protein